MNSLVPTALVRTPVKSAAKGDSVAFTFLIAMGFAVAVTTGAALSGIASGAVQDLLHTAGAGANDAIQSEQQRQGRTLSAIERSLDVMRGEVGRLAVQVDSAAETAKSAPEPVTAAPEAAKPESGQDEIALSALRSSIDEHEEHTRAALAAVNKRVDWLETLVYSRDATGSVVQPNQAVPAPPAGTMRRRNGQNAPPRWLLLHAQTGVAVVAGKNGTVDVTPGYVLPELGRVAEIRIRDGRWQVVTEKGIITQR